MSQPVPPPGLLNPDGSPRLTTSQRRSQIDETRFVDIRHLVYMSYKKPDQTPLMQYEDTLDNRDVVKAAALNYELNAGWIIRDGTEGQGPVAVQPQPAVQGVPQMSNAPFNPPPNGAPQFQPPPQQQFQPPPPQGQQQFAPPPQQQFQPPQQMMQAPPVASPQQAAQPQQQEQPAAPPSGRKRKGAAVAPPPPPPPPQPGQPQQFAPPPGQVPQQQFQAPPQQGQIPVHQFQPQAQGFQPPPQQSFVPQAQQGQASPPATSVDLTPVLQRLDAIGKICEAQAKELVETKTLALKALAVLHHMYLVNSSLQPQAGQPAVPRTLPEFQAFLTQFTGTP